MSFKPENFVTQRYWLLVVKHNTKILSVIVMVLPLHSHSCVTQYQGRVFSSDHYLNDTTALNAKNVHISVGSCS